MQRKSNAGSAASGPTAVPAFVFRDAAEIERRFGGSRLGVPGAVTGEAFVPVPVERPGGGRITDKTPPDPADLVVVEGHGRTVPLHRLAAGAWAALVAAARTDGHEAPLLLPVSGFRSLEEQAWLWEGALAKYGDPEVACLWVARPGTSAHQSGRAVDCHLGDPIESEYADRMRTTAAYAWLVAHAEPFGFYPYDVEPWHWEYNPPWAVSAGRPDRFEGGGGDSPDWIGGRCGP